MRLGTPCLPLSLSGEFVGCVGRWWVRSGVEPGPLRAAARPAARPLLSLLSNFSLSMGAGWGSPGFPETIETTITLSLPWEAWAQAARTAGVGALGDAADGRATVLRIP